MTILSIDIYTSALNFEAVIFMIASSSSAYFHTSEHLHFAAVFLYPCPDHHSMHIPSLLKSERIALGVWKVRFGTPSAYTPTAHRSNEIKTEALSVLSAEQGAEPQLPFGTDDVISSRQHMESW